MFWQNKCPGTVKRGWLNVIYSSIFYKHLLYMKLSITINWTQFSPGPIDITLLSNDEQWNDHTSEVGGSQLTDSYSVRLGLRSRTTHQKLKLPYWEIPTLWDYTSDIRHWRNPTGRFLLYEIRPQTLEESNWEIPSVRLDMNSWRTTTERFLVCEIRLQMLESPTVRFLLCDIKHQKLKDSYFVRSQKLESPN